MQAYAEDKVCSQRGWHPCGHKERLIQKAGVLEDGNDTKHLDSLVVFKC